MERMRLTHGVSTGPARVVGPGGATVDGCYVPEKARNHPVYDTMSVHTVQLTRSLSLGRRCSSVVLHAHERGNVPKSRQV